MLPGAVKEPLQAHLERVRDVHARDLQRGTTAACSCRMRWRGSIRMPAASGRGSGCFRPHGSAETRASVSRSAFTSHESVLQKAIHAAARDARHRQARRAAHVATLLCDTLA